MTYNPRFFPKDRTSSRPLKGETRYYLSDGGHMPIPVLMLDDMGLGEWDLGHCKEVRRSCAERLLTAGEVTALLFRHLAHADFRLEEETRQWTARREATVRTIGKWAEQQTEKANNA